jgi:hypothetical protein
LGFGYQVLTVYAWTDTRSTIRSRRCVKRY